MKTWQADRACLEVERVGFVPTMGALHDGHTSLVERCVSENEYSVVSIFVNPTQFDRATDLKSYPNSLDDDLSRLEVLGVDAVLLPGFEDIYPDGYAYRLEEDRLARRFCGAHRDGHFAGVLTVVMKLLNIVRPQWAYFGEKDYQQLQLVRGMVTAFFMNVEVVGCPIVREADGLAMSSRNRRLDAQQRALAPCLYRELQKKGSVGDVRQRLEAVGFTVDYVEDFEGRRLAAVSLADIRLIDNVPIP